MTPKQECELLMKASRWGITDDMRKRMVQTLMAIVENDGCYTKDRVAAIDTMVKISALELQQQRLEVDINPPDKTEGNTVFIIPENGTEAQGLLPAPAAAAAAAY